MLNESLGVFSLTLFTFESISYHYQTLVSIMEKDWLDGRFIGAMCGH